MILPPDNKQSVPLTKVNSFCSKIHQNRKQCYEGESFVIGERYDDKKIRLSEIT